MEYNKKDLQNKILEIAKYIDKLCKDNNIEYFLMYGTCIGAVRHQGFIPWDDDFDIGMTYDNYLKFQKVCKEKLDTSKYFLQNYQTEKNFYLSFSKMRDINTTLIEDTNKDIDMHKNVSIDIFPLVAYPNKKIQQKLFKINRAFMLSADINVINNKILYIISRIIIKLFGRKRVLKYTRKYCTKFNIEKSSHLCSFCDGDAIKLNIFKKEWFNKLKYVKFEDTKLPIPGEYDKVLKVTYGNYMTIPSQIEIDNKQHGIIYLDLNKGPGINKKKLLFIIWSFTYGGGAETILANLVNHLDLEKYDIDIIEYWHVDTKEQCVDSRINILKPVVDATKATKIEKFLKKFLLENFPNKLRQKYIKKKYDYEIAFNYMIPTFLLSNETKSIAWFHGDIYELKEQKKNRKMQEKSLKKVSKIVTISKNTYNSVLNVFPQYKEKTTIINNSFDIDKIIKESKVINKYNKKRFTLLFVGRLDNNKNPLFLIEVANKLNKNRLDFELQIIGKGILKDELEKKISEYKLNDKVKLLGYQVNPYPFFADSDIVVLSSISEGFPTVIAEGMAFGKPFVSTNVGGTEELSNFGKCGFVANDMESYTNYIINLMEDKKVYNKMAKEAKEHINNFKVENQIKKFEELLQEIK